jgi:hypothetical protein
MKNLVFGALLAAAVSSAACGTSSDTSARITARWSFNTFANHSGTPNGACPVGYGTTAVYLRPWDPFVGDFTGPALASDLFDCAKLQGTTDPLDGIFQVWIQVESDDATPDGDQSIEMKPVYTDAGYMDFGWKLQKNGGHVHCEDVGVGHNGIATTAVSPSYMLIDKFDCSDGFGTTDVLAADTYLVTVTATNTAGVDVGASGPIDNVLITPPNGSEHALTSLGIVTVGF